MSLVMGGVCIMSTIPQEGSPMDVNIMSTIPQEGSPMDVNICMETELCKTSMRVSMKTVLMMIILGDGDSTFARDSFLHAVSQAEG